MLVLVAYDVNTEDVAGERRLRRVAKVCLAKGQRVQSSVFECLLDNAEYQQFKFDLERIIDKDRDSLRFYNLGNKYARRIEVLGRDNSYNPEGFLVL